MVRTTTARMPKGIVSTSYLHFVYWVLVIVWIALPAYYATQIV